MNTLETFIRRPAALLVAMALPCLLAFAACGVTEPDESPFQNVADYSWPTTTGTQMLYRVDKKMPDTTYTSSVTTEESDYLYQGQKMFRLHDDRSIKLRVLYLPLKDTLVTRNEEFGGNFLLVAPLEKGHTWISGYSDDANTQPSWRATVIERFSYLKLSDSLLPEGRQFRNVVVVKYEPLAKQEQGKYWIRFYAQGQGPIQTIQHFAPPIDSSSIDINLPNPTRTIKRTVLLETTPAAN